MSEELKPCAHCGNSETVYEYKTPTNWCGIECSSCGIQTKVFSTVVQARYSWNTRAYEAEIEALKETNLKLNAYTGRLGYENLSVKYQLSVALEALNKIDKDCTEYDGYRSSAIAREAIQQIQGIDNTK